MVEFEDLTPELRGESFFDEGTLVEVERDIIKTALIKTSGHKGKAAEFLGWSRAKFWRKTREYGIT